MNTKMIVYSTHESQRRLLEYVAKHSQSSLDFYKVLLLPEEKELDPSLELLIFLDQDFWENEKNSPPKAKKTFIENINKLAHKKLMIGLGLKQNTYQSKIPLLFDYECLKEINTAEIMLIVSELTSDAKIKNQKNLISQMTSMKLQFNILQSKMKDLCLMIEELFPEKGQEAFDSFCTNVCQGKGSAKGSNMGVGFMCPHANSCQMQKYQSYLKNKKEEWDLSGELKKIKALNDFTLMIKIDEVLQHLLKTRMDFCMQECPLVKKGVDFKHGDILVSDTKSLLQGQCYYCQEYECGVNTFFSLYNLKL